MCSPAKCVCMLRTLFTSAFTNCAPVGDPEVSIGVMVLVQPQIPLASPFSASEILKTCYELDRAS
jgi:hypothetical protein